MSQFFDIVRDGASCMVEPAWMRAKRALASTPADRPAGTVWTAALSDWEAGGRSSCTGGAR
jgi:hypothetical protein